MKNDKSFEPKESLLCFKTHSAILNHDHRIFDQCINDPSFNINERFQTSERPDENYLDYALIFRNFYAADKLIDRRGLILTSEDKQRMLELLIASRKYLLLYKSIINLEHENVPINKCISGVINHDYEKITGKRR